MTGWKTWAAGLMSILYGVVGIANGWFDHNSGAEFIIQGVAIIGLGHKIEKIGR